MSFQVDKLIHTLVEQKADIHLVWLVPKDTHILCIQFHTYATCQAYTFAAAYIIATQNMTMQ